MAAVQEDKVVPREMMCILGRIMTQYATLQIARSIKDTNDNVLLHTTLPLLEGEDCWQLPLSDLFSEGGGRNPKTAGV